MKSLNESHGSTSAASEPETIVHVLRSRAKQQPTRQAYIFLNEDGTEQASLTYLELDRKARTIASWLQSTGATGERVLLLYQPGLDYIAAFLGCLYAGAIAVPAYPPDRSRMDRGAPRFWVIAQDATPAVALTDSQALAGLDGMIAEQKGLPAMLWKATDELDQSLANQWVEPDIDAGTIAFLQYTSGSTSTPKGVMVSHGNVLNNERLIQTGFNHTQGSTFAGWLPLYHDMGLIGNVLQPLFIGAVSVLMSPLAFLQKPIRWLRAITRYKAVTSGGPNFAYDLCVRKTTIEERAGLDLSSWTTAFNGAEPVRIETIDRFSETFAPYGFRREAFCPCYGLAEATLFVSGGVKDSLPVSSLVKASSLQKNIISIADEVSGDGRVIVGCGQSLPSQRIVVANHESMTQCPGAEVGEIWVSGASVARGYWNRPEETEATFGAYFMDTGEGPFLRTGDIGFMRDGELFITGRLKDLIIVRGQNYYPHDIELTIQRNSTALRQGCGAAFSVEADGQEKLVVVQEIESRCLENTNDIIESLRRSVAEEHQLPVYAVALIKAGSLPKTSSGKIRRLSCRDLFLKGELSVVAQWREPVSQEAQYPVLESDPITTSVGAIEKLLISMLAKKLSLEPGLIDGSQSVSRYGLDSLAAIDLMHDLEANLRVTVPLTTFFQCASIGELASRVFDLTGESMRAAEFPAPSRESVSEFELSRGQQGLYFLHQIMPDVQAYNIAAAAVIRGPMDAVALRRRFQTLIERHPSLRTNFIPTAEGIIQRIQQLQEVHFREVNAASWTEPDLKQRVSEEANHKFDLAEDNLLRITLYKRAKESLLVMVVHHIVIDFWSVGILVRELEALCAGRDREGDGDLRSPVYQFSDYVEWQNRMLAGPDAERLWRYWKEKLSGELPSLALPTDRPRPPVQSYVGDSQHFKLSAESVAGLERLSRMCGTTLFMSLSAVFEAFLYRYTGQDDILLGTLTSGRSMAKFADVVGYFLNPVVLRCDLSDEPTFLSLLQKTRTAVLEAFEHQDYPFPLLIEKLQQTRDASRAPLVQAMLIYQKAHLPDQDAMARVAIGQTGERMRIAGTDVEFIPLNQEVAQFDLSLKVAATEDEMSGSLEYNTDLFDASTITRMLDHFKVLLEAILENPGLPIADLSIMKDAERTRLLFDWNDTSVNYPGDLSIHALFEQQVRRTPDAIALSFDEEHISYGELDSRANQLANYLIKLGVEPDSRVAICMSRSIEMLVGLLGILKSGAAYAPLDPVFPQERSSFMLSNSGARVIVTERRLIEVLPKGNGKVLCLDADWNSISLESSTAPRRPVFPENLAYVIYTSGSTGKPKGVMVSHRNVVNFFHAMDGEIGCENPGHWLAVTSISFDISVFELLWTLTRGFHVVIQGERDRAQYRSVPAQIERHGITHLQCTPSLAKMLNYDAESLTAFKNLRKFMFAGEALPLSLAQQFGEIIAGDIHNLYGPTETTIHSAAESIETRAEQITIGRPVANTAVYILDRRLEPAPIKVAGALYLAGDGVSRGYVNSPDLTAERFIPNPFSRASGDRMYATGDVSRYMPDGKIDFLGRNDQQVKLRGYRFELTEIEAVLSRHPEVLQVAVTLREDVRGDKRLVAHLVAAPGCSFEIEEIIEFLRKLLPEYMIPSAFVKLDAMPLTTSGKIDRKRLPAPEQSRTEDERRLEPPRTPVEEVLASIWADILGLDEIGIHNDFFKFGGHSILAAQLVSRLRGIFRVELPHQALFETPTIAGLASAMIKQAEQGRRIERIAELLLSVANSSDDELEAMLGDSRHSNQ
jgi:amino acid adenylation domain-containing protein